MQISSLFPAHPLAHWGWPHRWQWNTGWGAVMKAAMSSGSLFEEQLLYSATFQIHLFWKVNSAWEVFLHLLKIDTHTLFQNFVTENMGVQRETDAVLRKHSHNKQRGGGRKGRGRGGEKAGGWGGKDRSPNRPSEQAEYIPKVDLILEYYLGHSPNEADLWALQRSAGCKWKEQMTKSRATHWPCLDLHAYARAQKPGWSAHQIALGEGHSSGSFEESLAVRWFTRLFACFPSVRYLYLALVLLKLCVFQVKQSSVLGKCPQYVGFSEQQHNFSPSNVNWQSQSQVTPDTREGQSQTV